jgi:hypothetical protein
MPQTGTRDRRGSASDPIPEALPVFNLAQCEGLPENLMVAAPPPEPGLIEPKVEALIKASGIGDRPLPSPIVGVTQDAGRRFVRAAAERDRRPTVSQKTSSLVYSGLRQNIN